MGMIIMVFLVYKRGGRSAGTGAKCCCAKLVNNRKPTSIGSLDNNTGGSSSGSDPQLIHAIRSQLRSVHEELVRLKQERDIVDSELIETSTQILQSIGEQIRYGSPPPDEGTLTSSQLIRELEDTPARVMVPKPSAPVTRPVPTQPVTQAPAVHQASAPAGPRPVPHGVPVEHAPTGAGKAVPKMSSIAAARMKREYEMPTQAPVPSGPFGAPKGPFGSAAH